MHSLEISYAHFKYRDLELRYISRIPIFVLIIILSTSVLVAQEFEDGKYEQLYMLRLKNENDLYQYWYKSDKNFSDGIHIELHHHIFNNKQANWFLIGLKGTEIKDFSLSIGQDLFTPAETQDSAVEVNDRPYSALLYLTYSKVSNSVFKGRKVLSNFYLGVQGPGAKGEEVQNGVHEGIGNPTAKGWSNQLGNGLMLDYDVTYMQLLPIGNKFFESNVYGKGHIGTIYDYASAGINFRIGHYGDSYMNLEGVFNGRNKASFSEGNIESLSRAKRKLIPKHIRKQPLEAQKTYLNNRVNRDFQIYLNLDFHATYMFYDGTVEGSLISFQDHVYTQKTNEEDQLTLQGEYGINVQYKQIHIDFNRYLSNDSEKPGDFFGYGEISLSYIFY